MKKIKKYAFRHLTGEGIDYTNPVFRDANGQSRILAIWDQTIQEGSPPEGFLYGTEYTREDINRALAAQDPYSVVPSRDEIGHGSAMAEWRQAAFWSMEAAPPMWGPPPMRIFWW